MPTDKPKDEKLQKALARSGLGSRRSMEEWISAGRVTVDGKTAQIGERVTSSMQIRVDGTIVELIPLETLRTRVLAYYKPEGEICTRKDPEGRKTVYERLPRLNKGRWIAIGRLDLNTSGLLLFTNDGDLANAYMHPSNQIEREYAVRILGKVDKPMLERLVNGVKLDDGMANFDVIERSGGEGANQWFHVIIKEGRQREVRRLWESQDVKVSRLIRVRFGPYVLPKNLARGKLTELNFRQVKDLQEHLLKK